MLPVLPKLAPQLELLPPNAGLAGSLVAHDAFTSQPLEFRLVWNVLTRCAAVLTPVLVRLSAAGADCVEVVRIRSEFGAVAAPFGSESAVATFHWMLPAELPAKVLANSASPAKDRFRPLSGVALPPSEFGRKSFRRTSS